MSTENQNNNQPQPANNNRGPLAKPEKTIADSVLGRVAEFEKSGGLKLPPNYSAANAIRFAWLMLLQAEDKNNKPVLDVCTKESIANALLEMVTQGLNPMKKQCYFIAYGGKLQMQRSYQGSVAVARQTAGAKDVIANVIYQDDEFEYQIVAETGVRKLIKHEQKLENIDPNKIKGAYAIITRADGSLFFEVMTMAQITASWSMAKGQSAGNTPAHNKFKDQMCMKTVISRAVKSMINTSDDANLFADEEEKEISTEATIIEEIKDNANLEEIGLTEHEEISMPEIPIQKEEEKETVSSSGKIQGPGF